MYVCMYVSLHFPFAPQYFPQTNTVFPAFSQRGRPKTLSFSRFSAKGCRKPKPAKKPAGGIEPGTPVAPRRLRLVERHQIAARYVGDPPPPQKKTYVIDVGRGGVRGGVILYPLVSIRQQGKDKVNWSLNREVMGWPHNGRIQKWVSIAASIATALVNRRLLSLAQDPAKRLDGATGAGQIGRWRA